MGVEVRVVRVTGDMATGATECGPSQLSEITEILRRWTG